MTVTALSELLRAIRDVRVGILGDFCLDAYLLLDPEASESSVETGLSTRPVRTQRYALGGAGNVASNLLAMGVTRLSVFGVTGHDPFGVEMRSILAAAGANTDGLLVQRESWDTHVYVKPHERQREQHRIDFGNFNQLQVSTLRQLISAVEAALANLDILIVNQQVVSGLHTPAMREALERLIAAHPGRRIIVDSRHHPDTYGGTMRKINVAEATRVLHGQPVALGDLGEPAIAEIARSLYARWGQPLFLTRGEHGVCICDEHGFRSIPGLLILSPVDPVGAGDSMLAGIAAGLAVGVDAFRAAELGTLVAGVTVQKLMQTGTASPSEILAMGSDPDFRYHPDLARQPRKETSPDAVDVEIVNTPPEGRHFTHVIFDHDGTLSTLRQGWEAIMEPMMMRAVLGEGEAGIDDALHEEVRQVVRGFIDQTTGIQTLVQMKGLVGLVHRFKCVPESEILDEHGYKEMYNQQLLAMVNARIQKLNRGELSVTDLTIKNAVALLHALAARGLRLYLASGTDQADVERETEVLGYRRLFADRIYGAVGDATKEAKRIVLERIMDSIGADARIITFGDGPVEMRETHKRGGFAVGVASDEVRRYGWNTAKRGRLIEAGADIIIPDYSQHAWLLTLLFA
jgi:bifunctional ADP-heptose synthase (sugar kinase/adenylyltransferase)/phosphoglycolate phosphatase-like HAD superfamily hydrolase